ncbi:hypothetical protein, partial [Mesorhizobium sp. Cs1321R2N1]|uniref:hypothetical protein n=1 Tax=Mesorhizobium sp. Cs1321R2N1 TaxID=3015174 RepID=UPI00301DE3FC
MAGTPLIRRLRRHLLPQGEKEKLCLGLSIKYDREQLAGPQSCAFPSPLVGLLRNSGIVIHFDYGSEGFAMAVKRTGQMSFIEAFLGNKAVG